MALGISGQIAKKFLQTEITPLLALVGFLLGVFAVIITPREEEPQIDVTFANVFIPFPGATAAEVESLVSTPAEQVLAEISGLEHIYSVSRPGMSVLTVQYKVGEERSQAIVRLYNKIFSNQDWLPHNLGVGQPIIKPKGIDDVPIVSVTLWTEEEDKAAYDLTQVAHSIEAEIKRVVDTRNVYTIGATERVVHVLIDPQRLAAYDVSIDDLRRSLSASNQSSDAGFVVNNNQEIAVTAGQFLINDSEVANLIIAMKNNKPVYLSDVANVRFGADQPQAYVSMGTGMAATSNGISAKGDFPAVTIAVSKKPGSNAVEIAENVSKRMQQLRGTFIPDDVKFAVTRDYGKTADAKAKKLIGKLFFATAIVVLLIWWFLGFREAIIVGVAIAITLAITLFASWAWGFTLNRVSLFALIFSIGILVDDAIVVVENIHRHMTDKGVDLVKAIPLAVDEVGGPTILATFTVIAALLPMAFVSGLMGPYMSPIPINASLGMLISLAVAFIITPWLALKLLKTDHIQHHDADDNDKSLAFFSKIMSPFIYGEQQKRNRRYLTFGVVFMILASVSLAVTKDVVLKMLPFDNKSEFQIVVDTPEGTSLEHTKRVLDELTVYLKQVPEISDYQVYAGTSAPINFNGLVRQYYLRNGANVGDIQVNLQAKHLRERKSHEVASSLRQPLKEIGLKLNAIVKVVEVPPGPPVMSPLVAEIYGPDYKGQIEQAKKIRAVFENTADIVDVDDSVEYPSRRYIVKVDRNLAAMMGVSQQAISNTLSTLLRGEDMGFLHAENAKYAVPIRVELPAADKSSIEALLSVKVRSINGSLIPLMDMVSVLESTRQHSIYHKDLLPVVYVSADMAGELDSPLYGMFDIISGIDLDNYFISQPEDPYEFSLKWDGEWTVTYETFRDMGIAYSVGLLMIYLLVVAQFRSYLVPLIIMAPIPLTIIGVMPGHALLGAKYTATSMIGMIALAGIIVRNSILLVDFINEQLKEGIEFQKAVILASAVRAKPIILTGVAAMMGAMFILDDPIFSGLAVSLIFGILISTMLTLVIIPVMYYSLMKDRQI
ncbi:MAG: efflux RND transporter permease subunit [Gammaproteobacteria bacterium]|nr:efflux RND transporter permease subunit [Gammaproteobacteria bacterium]